MPIVVGATPASSHHAVGARCLAAGKHVLVEKPLTLVSARGAELAQMARDAQRLLLVGHTFVYNPRVVMLKQLMPVDHQTYVFFGVYFYLGFACKRTQPHCRIAHRCQLMCGS